MADKSRILIFNYVMDPEDPLLSHQLEIADSLAHNFRKVTVITGGVGNLQPRTQMQILNTDWRPGRKIVSIFRLLRISIPIILKGEFDSVFFHMTDLQCAILSPFVRIRGKKQILWYAHAKKSRYLRWATFWIDSIVTSTGGSCPISGKKVSVIGQAIDSEKFTEIPFNRLDLNNLIHIGRFDRSKNIEVLIEQSRVLRQEFKSLTLCIIGTPANQESRSWSATLVKSLEYEVSEGWLTFSNSIPRHEIRSVMENHGCFFHGYLGSLDKTLIEATLLGVPVVSINPEYLSIFGQWSSSKTPNLVDEYRSLRRLSLKEICEEIRRRRELALQNHSMKSWIRQLSDLLD